MNSTVQICSTTIATKVNSQRYHACNCCQMNRFLGKAAVSILSESLQSPPNNKFVTDEWQELRRTANTFEGAATDSESPLHSTFIQAILLPPEMFTRPRCNAIRARTPAECSPTICLLEGMRWLPEKNEEQTLPFTWHLCQKRIMPINRHVFRRMSRCPLGIVQLCFSLFLWRYQYILGPNYQNKLGPVEHHWFEGKSHQFVCVTNIFNLRENFGLFLKLLIGRTHR